MNQIIICHNTAKSKESVQRTLAHEMVHMFDYCSNHLDFRDLEHLACTEIRAANLAHCAFLDAYAQTSGVFNVRQRHMVNLFRRHSIIVHTASDGLANHFFWFRCSTERRNRQSEK